MRFSFALGIEAFLNEYNCFLYSEVRVEGLETLDYLDNLKNKERFTEQGDAITFETEVGFCQSFWLRSFCIVF